MEDKFRVRYYEGMYYPERYDESLGWVGYKHYADFLSFENSQDAWAHINNNPDQLNVSCD